MHFRGLDRCERHAWAPSGAEPPATDILYCTVIPHSGRFRFENTNNLTNNFSTHTRTDTGAEIIEQKRLRFAGSEPSK